MDSFLLPRQKPTIVCKVSQTVFEVLKDPKYVIRWFPLQIPYSEELADMLKSAINNDARVLDVVNLLVTNSGEEFLLNDICPKLGMMCDSMIRISGPKNIVSPIRRIDFLFCIDCPGFIRNNNWLSYQGQCDKCRKNRNLIQAEYVDYRNKKHIHLRYKRSFP